MKSATDELHANRKTVTTAGDKTEDGRGLFPNRIAHFEVIDWIGHGGEGWVARARDPLLDREVAIKLPLPPDEPRSGETAAHLRQEAQKSARLRHESIVTVYELGETSGLSPWPDGVPFLVMEYMPGGTLRELLNECHAKGEKLPFDRAARILIRIAEGLHYAQQEGGLIHCDMKPQNILIDSSGHPRISDFGLALLKAALDNGRSPVAGTCAYMSPERLKNELDLLQTDIWSLGVIFYEMLTDELPFHPERRGWVHHIISSNPARPRDLDRSIPEPLETICLKCLEKKPAARYPTGKDLADAVRSFLDQPSASAKREPL
jgi:serine/threonine-protein kinase